jgi:pimeloyl-ACP methyl ester carboxylesterase/DNA-binding CsgD family transcriptional regulator
LVRGKRLVAADGASSGTEEVARAFARWFEEIEQILEQEPPGQPWAREPVAPVFGQADGALLPIVDARSLAVGVYDASGERIAATASFTERCAEQVEATLVKASAAGEGPTYRAISGQDGAGATSLFVYAPGSRTSTWRLPAEIHEAAHSRNRTVVVLTTTLDDGIAPLRDACVAYGLTGLQTRVALQTIRVGEIKKAAANLGLSYQTAREALSEAIRRAGADNLPGLVTRLSTLAFGVFPGRPTSGDLLADAWGLTERQIAVAGMVAEGATRKQAARLLGLSLAIVKKELDAAYSLLHVNSSAGLARKIVEARALNWLTAASAGGLGFVEDQSEPLRFALRPGGARIAFSDYGPASGRPVLILHSSMTTRIVSRKLLRVLHSAGFRPIAIDRPGFGLTDPLSAAEEGADPFIAAAGDVARVLEHLKIRQVDIVARGAAQVVIAITKALPEAVGRVVLVNPGPPTRYSGGSVGPFGAMKDAFIRNPAAARLIAPFLATQITHRRLSHLLPQWMRGSPPDEAAARDPQIVADFFRSLRMFATGRYAGFLEEQAAHARAGRLQRHEGAAGWRVLLGATDVLYDPDTVLAFWRETLPGARFELAPGAGRLLAMTHPELVVEALVN